MNTKWIKFFGSLIGSITVLITGIILLVEANYAMPFIRYIFITVLSILTIVRMINIFVQKNKRREHILFLIIYIILNILLIHYPNTYVRFIGLIVGLYAIVNAIINYVDFRVKRANHLNGVLFSLFKTIVYFIFGILLILMPQRYTAIIFVIGGIYLIILGSFNFLSAFKDMFNKKFNIAVPLPVIFSTLLPVSVFLKIKSQKEIFNNLDDNPFDDEKIPLEIFIYVQESGFESFGHCDVSVEGTIYSYGLHDPKARKLMGSLGEGVLVKVNRSAFLENSMKTGKTMIFSFGIYPSDEEMTLIKSRINSLMEDATPFYCDAKLQEMNGEDVTADDYISDVYKDTNCELFKFKKGKFKTYFVFTSNCVELVDYIIRNKDIDLLKINGIASPGTYLNFLYQLFLKEDSIIKKLKVYKKHYLN